MSVTITKVHLQQNTSKVFLTTSSVMQIVHIKDTNRRPLFKKKLPCYFQLDDRNPMYDRYVVGNLLLIKYVTVQGLLGLHYLALILRAVF